MGRNSLSQPHTKRVEKTITPHLVHTNVIPPTIIHALCVQLFKKITDF